MKLFENGVGRPSNEIKKKRKIFIASVVAAVAIIITLGGVLLFGKSDITNLKGASNGSYYMNMSVKNSSVSTSGCNITIPISIHNTKKKEMKITSAKITYSGSDAALSSKSIGRTLAGNTQYTQYVTFNMKNFSSLTNNQFKVVVYFTVNGKQYYKYDLYGASTSVMNALRQCKNPTTKTTTKTTTKKTAKPVVTTKTTTKATTRKTTKATASQNGKAYINHYVTNSAIEIDSKCNLVVEAKIENRSNQKIKITSSKLTDASNNKFTSVNKTLSVAAGVGKKGVVEFKFPAKDLKDGRDSYRMVTYFQVNGKGNYYITETITLPNDVVSRVKTCKPQDGSSYLTHTVRNNTISVDKNCKLVVETEITNKDKNYSLNITSAKLTDASNNKYVSVNKKQTIKAGVGKKGVVTYKFPVKNIPTNSSSIRMVTYFTAGNREFWKTEYMTLSSSVLNKINSCKKASSNSGTNSSSNKNTNSSSNKNTNSSSNKNTNSNSSKQTFSFACPTVAMAYREVTCFANKSGVKIDVQKTNLSSGYSPSFTTTSSDKTKQMLFTKPGKYTITASDGSYTTTRTITVVASSAGTTKFLYCPGNAYVNKEFSCFTNQSGVTLSVSRVSGTGSMTGGHSWSYTTKAADLSKQIKWSSNGKIKVCAKNGSKSECVNVNIVRY